MQPLKTNDVSLNILNDNYILNTDPPVAVDIQTVPPAPVVDTEKNKPTAVDRLIKLIEDHEKTQIVPRRSLIEEIWDNFKSFVRNLLGLDHSFEEREIKLKLAMHHFRCYDASILRSNNTSKSNPTELPLSVSLEAYYSTLQNFKKQLDVSDEKIQALGECVGYSKTIDSIKSSFLPFRSLRLQRLTEEITQRINSLKDGESIFLPGGYMQVDKSDDVNSWSEESHLASLTGKSIPMIYEVKKDPQNSSRIILRVFDNSIEGNSLIKSKLGVLSACHNLNIPIGNVPVYRLQKSNDQKHALLENNKTPFISEFRLQEKDLTDQLYNLLEVQISPHEYSLMNGIERLYYNWKLTKRFIANHKQQAQQPQINNLATSSYQEIYQTLPPMVQDLSAVKLYKTFQHFKQVQVKSKRSAKKYEFTAKKTDSPDALKIVELFSKTLLKDKEPERKLYNKIALFLDIFKDCQPRLSDIKVRLWLKENLYTLIQDLSKVFSDDFEIEKILECFKEKMHTLLKYEDSKSICIPKGVKDLPPQHDMMKEPVYFTESTIPLNSFLHESSQSQRSNKDLDALELTPPELKSNPHLPFLFLQQFKTCQYLSDLGNVCELRYAVLDAFESLKKLDSQNLWNTLSSLELEAWSNQIHLLAGYLYQAHFGANIKSPTSLEIASLLKALSISIKLAQHNDKNTGFEDFSVDMTPFRDILRDNYLNLSLEGPEIYNSLNEIEAPNKKLLKLTDPNPLHKQLANDKQFFLSYLQRFRKTQVDSTRITEDFSLGKGHLNPQIVHIRRLKILALSMMAKYRTLGNPDIFSEVKDALITFVNSFTKKSEDLDQEYINRMCANIDKALYSKDIAPPGDFDTTTYFLNNNKILHVNPELDYIDYDKPLADNLKSPFASRRLPSQYKLNEPRAPDEFAKKILEGCVSDCEGRIVNEEGICIPPSPDNPKIYNKIDRVRFVPSGECHTERYIYENSENKLGLPSDIMAELTATKTSPLGTRIPNTLEFFVEHPNYLGSTKYALWCQQLMNLNLFRNNNLAEYLNKHPLYTTTLVSHLTTLFAEVHSSQNIEGTLFVMQVISNVSTILQSLVDKNLSGSEKLGRGIFSTEIAALTGLQERVDSLLEDWSQKCEDNLILKPHKRLIYQTYLLLSKESSKTNPLYLLKCWFKMNQIPQSADTYNFINEDRIKYQIHRILPVCALALRNKKVRTMFLNELIKELNFEGNSKSWNIGNASLLFHNENLCIDLKNGLFLQNGAARCTLPETIIQDPLCRQMFDEHNIHSIWCEYKVISHESQEGFLCQFEYKQQPFAIVKIGNQPPLIYRQCQYKQDVKSEWFQLAHTGFKPQDDSNLMPLIKQVFNNSKKTDAPPSSSSFLPDALMKNQMWISCSSSRFFVEGKDHEILFEGEFEGAEISEKVYQQKHVKRNLKQLTAYAHGEKKRVINPWKEKAYAVFSFLAPPSKILMTCPTQDSETLNIRYLESNLEYTWTGAHPDPALQDKWACKNYPGYYLSSKKLEPILSLEDANSTRNFFAEQFHFYHILEHPSQPSLLLLPCQEYQKNKTPLAKNRKEYLPVSDTKTNLSYYDYIIDPYEGLKSKSPEGYFYLAYILFIQSEYEQALFYLKKAQQINPETSPDCQRILSWFSQWKISSLDAKAFMLNVYLLILDQSPHIKKTSDLNSVQRNLLINFIKVFYQYDFTKPMDCLKLRQNDYAHACEYIQLVDDHIEDFIHLGSEGNENEIEQQVGCQFSEIKNAIKLSTKPDPSPLLDVSRLDEQKENLEKSMDLTSSHQLGYVYKEVNRPIFGSVRKFLSHPPLKKSSQKLDLLLNDLQSEACSYDIFEDQIKMDLVQDILKAKNQQTFTSNIIDPLDYPKVKACLDADITDLTSQVNEYRTKILEVIRPRKKSARHTFEQELGKAWEVNHNSFREILYAAASQELSDSYFNTYYKVELAKNTDMVELAKNVRVYLERLTLLQQHQKAKHLLEQCQHINSPSLNKALADLLSIERLFDCQEDPHAIAILLLESEQKVISRKSQLENFRTMIGKRNIFKHAALADGKTTFLRHLISKFKANRQNLSCLITHEPLISVHHKQLEKATSEAYGDKVYRFEFNRDDATDLLSLRIIRNHLLTCITQNGRFDFTPHDMLSLHHSYILKFEELFNPHSKRSQDVIHEEIDILSEILEIIKTKATVSSDEIDKIVEANKQHNYGLGKPSKLNENKCLAGSQLVEWILNDEELQHIFKNSDIELWKYAHNKNFELVFLKKMAAKVIKKYLPNISLEYIQTALLYLTDTLSQSSEEVKKFRQEIVSKLPSDTQLTLKTFHKLFHKIIPESFKKRNGLNFIRSEDGVQVKPVIRNGKCSELSEFGTEEETIWYTCLSYMNSLNSKTAGGVTSDQIAQLVLDLKNEAAKDLAKRIKQNPHEYILFNQTESAVRFRNNFNINLDAVTSEHYPLLAKRLNNNPSLLASFLNQYVFPIFECHSHQIVGTPHHLVAMFNEFSGSSGTSNIWRSLPEQIHIDADHVKQPGADGSVLLNLIQTFSLSDLIQYDDTASISEQMGNLLKRKPGNALIDCAPVFPGLTVDKIIESISPFMPKKSLLRYTNDEEQEVVFDNESQTSYPDNSISIDNAFTIFDKAQTRGTNKDLPYESSGMLTINKLTTLSEFLQSAMRMRKFGKGQKIQLVVDPHTYNCLVQNGSTASNVIKNLINLLCHNESEFLKHQHHIKSEIQKLQSKAEITLYYSLLKIKNHADRKVLWQHYRHYFIKPSQETLESMDDAEMQKSHIALETLAQNEAVKLKKLIEQISNLDIQDRDELINTLQPCLQDLELKASGNCMIAPRYLPAYSYSSSADLQMNNFVQKEQNIKTDREIEEEIDLEKKTENLPKQTFVYCWKDIWDKGDSPSVEILLTKLQTPSETSSLIPITRYTPFYDKSIFFTHNLFRPVDKSVKYLFPDLLPWGDREDEDLPTGQTRIFKIALIVDRRCSPNAVYGVLGSLKDFDHVFCQLQDSPSKESGVDYFIYSLTTDSLVGGNWPEDYSPDLHKKLTRTIVQAKHLAGEINLQDTPYNPESQENTQTEVFKSWLIEKFEMDGVNIVHLEKNLRKYLRQYRPSISQHYSVSTMARIYSDCKRICKKLVQPKDDQLSTKSPVMHVATCEKPEVF